MKEARAVAEKNGVTVRFFAGDNLTITDKNGKEISVRAYIKNGYAFVRADHPLYTAEQLMRHEAGHHLIEEGKINLDEVRERLIDIVGEEDLAAVARMYTKAYDGSGMTAEEIWEECVCDSLGDMNIFAGDAKIGRFMADILPEIKTAAESQVEEANETRGPPEGKASSYTTLTDAETAALLAYKSGGSYTLNAKLREGISLDSYEQKIVDAIDSALEKVPVYKGKVYRNISFDGFGDKAARDSFLSNHIIQEDILYSAYTSTSSSVDGYPIDGEYIVHFEIDSISGKNMDGIGNNFESEVLFPRDTGFIVNDITYDNSGTPTIYLTEAVNEQATASTGRTEKTHSVGDRGQQKASAESDSSAMQRLSEQNTRDAELQNLYQGKTEGNTKQSGDLQGVRTEVEDFDAKTSRELDFIKYLNEEADLYEYVDSVEENSAETDEEVRSRLKTEKSLTNRQLLRLVCMYPNLREENANLQRLHLGCYAPGSNPKGARHKKHPIFLGCFLCGAPWRIRTFDLPVRSRALYPLS